MHCALEQPEIDSDRVFTFGGSQGGGLALLVTALEKRIRAVVAHVPNLCHMDLGPFMGHAMPPGFHTEAHAFFAKSLY